MRAPRGRRGRFVAGLLAGGLLTACGSAPPPATPTTGPPWEIPADAFGAQRLYRLQVAGARGEGSGRLVLRLVRPGRYELAASDPLGRPVWALSVVDGEGRWLDYRARRACAVVGEIDLRPLELPSLPLDALPALLLDRVPAAPPEPPPNLAAGPQLVWTDRDGRRWTVRRRGDEVVAWTLGDAAGRRLAWRREGAWRILDATPEATRVRWREVLREPLRAAPDPPLTPAGFSAEGCDAPDLP